MIYSGLIRKLGWLIVLSPSLSSAQGGDGPSVVNWSCMDVAVSGLRWNQDTETYRDESFFMQQHRVQQKKDQLIFPAAMGFREGYSCGFRPNIPVLSCDDGVYRFNLNVQTGYATHSKGYGWMDPYGRPEPMFVAASVCRQQ